MMNRTSNISPITITAAAISPVTMICTGDNLTVSASCSERLRTPKNADSTVFTTASGEALRGSLPSMLQPGFFCVPATSKNVYDNVTVPRSLGMSGSMTNTTGILRTSPGPKVCCWKQKHSSFWKYCAARWGP